MNARDRIIEALAEAEAQPVINIPDLADAVLAVVPDLLTDPEVKEAMVDKFDDMGTWRQDDEVADIAIAALVEALTGGAS